jgi:hypothetical protein
MIIFCFRLYEMMKKRRFPRLKDQKILLDNIPEYLQQFVIELTRKSEQMMSQVMESQIPVSELDHSTNYSSESEFSSYFSDSDTYRKRNTFVNCSSLSPDTRFGEVTYTCEIEGCNKIFKMRARLIAHQRRTHASTIRGSANKSTKRSKSHKKCNVCKNTRLNDTNMSEESEERLEETAKSVYVCKYPECTYYVEDIADLKAHSQEYHQEHNLECAECKKNFKSRTLLVLHRQRGCSDDPVSEPEVMQLDLTEFPTLLNNSASEEMASKHSVPKQQNPHARLTNECPNCNNVKTKRSLIDKEKKTNNNGGMKRHKRFVPRAKHVTSQKKIARRLKPSDPKKLNVFSCELKDNCTGVPACPDSQVNSESSQPNSLIHPDPEGAAISPFVPDDSGKTEVEIKPTRAESNQYQRESDGESFGGGSIANCNMQNTLLCSTSPNASSQVVTLSLDTNDSLIERKIENTTSIPVEDSFGNPPVATHSLHRKDPLIERDIEDTISRPVKDSFGSQQDYSNGKDTLIPEKIASTDISTKSLPSLSNESKFFEKKSIFPQLESAPVKTWHPHGKPNAQLEITDFDQYFNNEIIQQFKCIGELTKI